jgi:hypothetical protein
MARVFDITAGSDAVRLDTKGQGDAAFTISNVSGRRVRGRAKVVPKDPSTAGWLSLAGDAERDFPAGGTHLFTAKVAVPPEGRPGTYPFRLDVISVDNPDEETTQGPTVAFTVAEAPPPAPKSHTTSLILAVILVLVVGGAAIWLVRPRPGPPPPPVVAAASFAGDWSTDLARLALKQDGEKVSGEYRMYGSDAPVRVEGTVHDRTLTGSLGDASKTRFSVTLDAGNDTFHGTRDAKKAWCGQRSSASPLPPDCGFTGVWTFKFGQQSVGIDLKQTADEVKGTVSGQSAGRSLRGDMAAKLRGWVLEGIMHLGVDNPRELEKRVRWTLVNQEFRQFQGVEFALVVPDDPRIVVYLEDNCGARQGTPLPQPCSEPSGTVLDSFTIDAKQIQQWDNLAGNSMKDVEIVGGDFRATIAVKARTTRHGDMVGFGVTGTPSTTHWISVVKAFASDANPNAFVGIVSKRGDLLEMVSPTSYAADTVHFSIERRGDRFTFSYSPDGQRWSPVRQDLEFAVGRNAKIFAVAYSGLDNPPLSAELSGLTVTER